MKKKAFNLLMYGISIVLLVLIFCSLMDNFIFSEGKQVIDLEQPVERHQGDIAFGDSHSTQTVYVYFSYKCGYCKRFFREVYPSLKQNYIDKGELQLVLKLVEASQDPGMKYALQVALGVQQFGEYDAFHKLLLHDSKVVYTEDFKLLCDDILASNSEIAQYVLEGNALDCLEGNFREYEDMKLSGTPSFIINQKLYKGYLNFNEFEELLKN